MSDNDLIMRGDVKAKKVYCDERHEYVVPVAEIDWLIPAVPQEMSAVKYLKAEQRMCFDENVGKRNCLTCPLSSKINPARINCGDYTRQHPEKAVAIVGAWVREHPERSEEC